MEVLEPAEVDAGRVRLRPWHEDDADAVLAAQQDDGIKQWVGGRGIETRADAVALIRRLTGSEDRTSWAVVDPATGELLGSVSRVAEKAGTVFRTVALR